MVEFYFYKVDCGDAARIRFIGTDGKVHNVFIDGGYERTFRYILADEIRSIESLGEKIDLWIISHIHDDHIGGVVAYINAIMSSEFRDIVSEWQFNCPRIPISFSGQTSISQATSIGQGDVLTNYLSSINKIPQNDITNERPPFDLWGMKIWILSPDKLNLSRLRNKYPAGSLTPLERIENDTVSTAKGAVQSDYHCKLEEFNLSNWKEDTSIENGSSIAVLTAIGDKRTLWLGDAFPSVVSQSLREFGYSPSNPLTCEWVKVSHHGSSGNNSDELYQIVRCNNYIISANAENKYRLPTKECIARILRNSNRSSHSHYNFYFTNDNQTLKSIFLNDKEEIQESLRFTTHYLHKLKKAWSVS